MLPDLSDDENDLLAHLLGVLDSKAHFNMLVDAYYDAERNVRMAYQGAIPEQYLRLGMVLGWSEQAVDALSARCNLSGMVWPDGDLDSLGFRELWDGNRLGSEVDEGITESLIHAVSFVTAARGEEGEPPALIHFHSASDATGDWNARTRSLDNLLVVNARDDQGPSALTLYLPGRTVTAVYENFRWSSNVSEHPWGVPAAALAYKPRLKRPFGRSRISRPVRYLQDSAARALARLEGHMDVYAYPEFWMLGADSSVFRNDDGTVKPEWQVRLGRIKGIPDDQDQDDPQLARVDVRKFDAASPEPHLAALNFYAKMFARATKLPDTAVAITDFANPTSADSYGPAERELITDAERATDRWSSPLRNVVSVALAMQNGLSEVPTEWQSIECRWRPVKYESRAAAADAGMKQLSAAPWLAETEVGLELLGLDSQQIRRALADRRRAEGRGVLADLQAAAARVTNGDAG